MTENEECSSGFLVDSAKVRALMQDLASFLQFRKVQVEVAIAALELLKQTLVEETGIEIEIHRTNTTQPI